MAMLKKGLGIFVGLVAVLFISGFILPSQVHVERAILINATPTEIFPVVSDLTAWDSWSPWANLDPDMEMTITGSGVGQTMHWHSEDPRVGDGTQEITALASPNSVRTHLDFGSQGIADAALTLNPQDNGTLVSWSLDTDMREGVSTLMKPINTYFGFLMDSLIGKDYEAGLASLKAVIEASTPN
jgi:hypothetical protein